jgi:hypothetical protein
VYSGSVAPALPLFKTWEQAIGELDQAMIDVPRLQEHWGDLRSAIGEMGPEMATLASQAAAREDHMVDVCASQSPLVIYNMAMDIPSLLYSLPGAHVMPRPDSIEASLPEQYSLKMNDLERHLKNLDDVHNTAIAWTRARCTAYCAAEIDRNVEARIEDGKRRLEDVKPKTAAQGVRGLLTMTPPRYRTEGPCPYTLPEKHATAVNGTPLLAKSAPVYTKEARDAKLASVRVETANRQQLSDSTILGNHLVW